MHAVCETHAFRRAAAQSGMSEDDIFALVTYIAENPLAGETMSKKAFDKIAEGLTEALAIARGEKKPARLHVPPEIDVRAIRARTGLSQDDFATAFGFTINQIREWEQGRARPLGGVRAYLIIIERDPKRVLELLKKARGRKAA